MDSLLYIYIYMWLYVVGNVKLKSHYSLQYLYFNTYIIRKTGFLFYILSV